MILLRRGIEVVGCPLPEEEQELLWQSAEQEMLKAGHNAPNSPFGKIF